MAELNTKQNSMDYFMDIFKKAGQESRKGLMACIDFEISKLQAIKEGFIKIDEENK